MSYLYPGYSWSYGHCPGCRCFANIWPSTGTLTTTTYVPRHRKPGPAQ